MKCPKLVVVCIAILVVLTGCNQWKNTGSTSKADKVAYTGMYIDDTHVLAVGYSGLVQHSEDGGKTWNKGVNNSMCMFACDMIDDTNYFATGNGKNFIISNNSGKAWNHGSNILGGPKGKSISFTSRTHGWAASKTVLCETIDRGQTWNKIELPEGVSMIETVSAIAEKCGYIVSSKGQLYRTLDAGKTWTELSTPIPINNDAFKPIFTTDNQGIAIRMDTQKGTLAAICKAGKSSILLITTTEDGGKTWSKAEKHTLKNAPMTVIISKTGIISVFDKNAVITKFQTKA